MSKIGFVYAGQGSQVVGMGKSFYDNYQRSQPLRSIVFEGANLIGFKLPYFPADIQYELKNRCETLIGFY